METVTAARRSAAALTGTVMRGYFLRDGRQASGIPAADSDVVCSCAALVLAIEANDDTRRYLIRV